ncbi:MAG: hypothetical protein BVN31_07425 [Proteobacteria bacterium ST_bin15]|nr:MAG: hypothetical protein BVN31_07425 [Proteobacteria bacterium ST_bin15]
MEFRLKIIVHSVNVLRLKCMENYAPGTKIGPAAWNTTRAASYGWLWGLPGVQFRNLLCSISARVLPLGQRTSLLARLVTG